MVRSRLLYMHTGRKRRRETPPDPKPEEGGGTGGGSGGGTAPVEREPLSGTKDHIRYLRGYPDQTFQAEQNMTRAEAWRRCSTTC